MEPDKNKQIAPVVVLAQHGNKDAMRNIYIQYYKNIFFISKMLTGDASAAMVLTVQIFTKMFESVEKLDDHMAFEPWFYSLAVNLCKSAMNKASGNAIVSANMIEVAKSAVDCAKSGDSFGFERAVIKLLEEMICSLPDEAKIIFFYRNTAMLDTEKIALLEKTQEDEVEKAFSAVDVLFEKQSDVLRQAGVDVSPFISDINATLSHLVAKTFVPDAVHAAVTEKTGVNVDPFAQKKEPEAPAAEKAPAVQEKETAEKKEKKKLLSKSDLILFIVVAVIAFGIFSGIKIYRSIKADETVTTTAAPVETVVKPVLTWNGSAASSFSVGSGTQDDPYVIVSGAELAYLANLVNSGNSQYAQASYLLGCDIILNETDDFARWSSNAPDNRWTPIGSSADAVEFTGTFDGNGFAVVGMYVSGEYENSGLFGKVKNAGIKNLTVRDSYISSTGNCGGIAGYVHGDSLMGTGISKCAFTGVIVSSGDNAGGIVGCVEADGEENFVTIEQCYSLGSISSEGNNAGGIAGLMHADSGDVKIAQCFSAAEISASADNAGGIAGCCKVTDGDSSVFNSYFSGSAAGGNDESVGGITGVLECANGEGVVNVMYCVALESSAPTLTGMILADRMSVKSVKTATADEMKTEEVFEAYDFDAVWDFDNSSDYDFPVLLAVELAEYSHKEDSSL